MKARIAIILSVLFLLFTVGIANAAYMDQKLLNAKQIPQFVEPLPLLEFEFINATSGPLPAGAAGLNTLIAKDTGTFDINAEEFRAQILPTPLNWKTAPPSCGVDTASSVWGYRTVAPTPGEIRPTYLGPVVISETGVAVNPIYGNNLPVAGVVQANLPIDWTLDWADPTGATGPVGCDPDPITHDYRNPACANVWTGAIPIATHLHGGEVEAAYDGGPDAWFTQDFDGIGGPDTTGSGYPGAQYNYPNNQQEGTIWFHDHALGITRLNVYAGLAGLMPIIDPDHPPVTPLPQLADGYDIPLIIQDRTFDKNCEIFYNLASNPQPNPTVHPFWIPEFIGDTIVVNGKTWPYLKVEPRQYRFRLVNGSNARFYDLTVNLATTKKNKSTPTQTTLPLLAIATDDGYLMTAVTTPNVTIGPGERYEIIVDFSTALAGTEYIMMNSARTPFPGGGAVVKGLTDRVMKFNVVTNAHPGIPSTTVADGSLLRRADDDLGYPGPGLFAANPIHDIKAGLVPMTQGDNPNDPNKTIVRQLTLNEVIGPGGPLELVVNNSKLNQVNLAASGCQTTACRETEIPQVGDTEIWEIINITADAHPMHTHLTSFQVINRQPFAAATWVADYDAQLFGTYGVDSGGKGPPNQYDLRNADGAIGGNPPINASTIGFPVRLPLLSEQGWKDTVITYPGEVTRIAVRWTPTDIAVGDETPGTNQYDGFTNGGFDPTQLVIDPNDPDGIIANVGYVWHCHIIDHEDNEMMRNYTVGTARQPIF